MFDGTISTATEHYYVEPVSRYLSSNQSGEPPPHNFHSIIYKYSDIVHPSSHSQVSTSLVEQHVGFGKKFRVSIFDGKLETVDLWSIGWNVNDNKSPLAQKASVKLSRYIFFSFCATYTFENIQNTYTKI